MSEFVPAWRKLGLKLKRETNDTGHNTKPYQPADQPRRTDITVAGLDEVVKRRKLNSSKPARVIATPETAATKEVSLPKKRRKSVSFSEDTKADDGDTRVTIDFPPTPVKERSKRSGHVISDSDLENGNGTDQTVIKSVKKPKQKKESKLRKSNQPSNGIQKSNDALDYLTQHHEDRISWKFKKNRDTWILKNALSNDKIPKSYDLVLAGYIHGLPANAGARPRLIEQCHEATKAMPAQDDGSSTEGLKEILTDEILAGSSSATSNIQQQLEPYPRAKILLLALGADLPPPSSNTGQKTSSGISTTQSARKKKKSRTNAVVDISSSSESESDSEDSDSDSSETSSGSSVSSNSSGSSESTSSSGTSSSSNSSGSSSSE